MALARRWRPKTRQFFGAVGLSCNSVSAFWLAGMLETTRIRREGYSVRPKFSDFIDRCAPLRATTPTIKSPPALSLGMCPDRSATAGTSSSPSASVKHLNPRKRHVDTFWSIPKSPGGSWGASAGPGGRTARAAFFLNAGRGVQAHKSLPQVFPCGRTGRTVDSASPQIRGPAKRYGPTGRAV